MAHRVPFLVAELGTDVDPFILHLFAALREKERALISSADQSGAGSSEGARGEAWWTEAGSGTQGSRLRRSKPWPINTRQTCCL